MTEPTFVAAINQNTVAIQSDMTTLSSGIESVAEVALSISKDLTHEVEQRIDAVTRLTKRLELTQLAVSVSMGISLGLFIALVTR